MAFEILLADGESVFYNLGLHPPRLWPDDVDLLHHLGLQLSDEQFRAKLHHCDVSRVALRRFDQELNSQAAPEVIHKLRSEVEGNGPSRSS